MKKEDRCKLIRKKILFLSQKVKALHIGGSFSSVELIERIFFKFKKKNDVFILSKGHAGVLLYTILNIMGKLSDKQYYSYCTKYGNLGVHPDIGKFGISASTGSLGHGLGMAAGIALANQKTNKKIFVLMSDGELQEGSVWEIALFISSKKLNNIILVIDNNNLQSSTKATDTHPTLYPISKKFESFGWSSKVCNGHDIKEIEKKIKLKSNKPLVLIGKTIKGYPVSFMKNKPQWHYRSPNKIEFAKAMKELS